MKKTGLALPLVLLFILLTACNSTDKNPSKRVIAERIEYPVFIKSPYGEDNGEYWKENLETSKRIDLVRTLFDWAYSGKVKTYDYLTEKPLSLDEVKAIGNESDTLTVARPAPPYDEYDTVINSKLDLNLIHKLKVLEEWSIDESNFSLEKKLIGIAPALTVYADSNEIKGYKPLFWMYFDKEYIKKLTEEK